MTFRLFSDDIQDGGPLSAAHVFNGWGHNGANRSPHLAWDGVPDGTESLVLTMYDPDAPTGSGFWHWVVVDIPADAGALAAGAGNGGGTLPAGARQTRTDAGAPGYVGAAPPPGPAHRYVFTLHALSTPTLPVADDASGAMVGLMAGMNRLATATLTATYGI
jgi:Raf kinase inhibitor-like YbhB/YbcL family protein